MAGASIPKHGSKLRRLGAQDGARKSGAIKTRKHAGPERRSKTGPSGTKGSQLEGRGRR